MSVSRTVVLESLTGVGQILVDGKVVATGVRYAIVVTQSMVATPTLARGPSEIEGLQDVSGRILSEVPFRLIGEPIELELDGGRSWKCFIQSSNGDLVSSGPITPR